MYRWQRKGDWFRFRTFQSSWGPCSGSVTFRCTTLAFIPLTKTLQIVTVHNFSCPRRRSRNKRHISLRNWIFPLNLKRGRYRIVQLCASLRQSRIRMPVLRSTTHIFRRFRTTVRAVTKLVHVFFHHESAPAGWLGKSRPPPRTGGSEIGGNWTVFRFNSLLSFV